MIFRFERFELDEARYELRRQPDAGGGAPEAIEVQPKVMEVLLHLLRNADRAPSKDELLDAVWGDVAITEASLTRCISLARRALGEHESEPRIIRTVRGRGYRIGVEVTRFEPESHAAAARADRSGGDSIEASRAESAAPALRATSRRRRAVAAVAACGLVLAATGWLARPFDVDLQAPDSAGQAPAPETAVAVLPFADLREPDSRSAVADALVLEVIDRLSRWPELQVASFHASFRFDPARAIDPRDAGRELAVGTLVTGSLHEGDDGDARLRVELVDAESGFQRWSESFRLPRDELASGRDAVAARVARALGVGAHATNPLAVAAASPGAASDPLVGRRAALEATREELLEMVESYERILELDPQRVRGYVALAEAYHRLWERDGELGSPGESWLTAAEAVALEALERAPRDPFALTIYGTVLTSRKRWQGAEAALRLALDHGGGAFTSHRLGVVLLMQGRIEEARPHVERALRLDPLSTDVTRGAGRFHLYAGEPGPAISLLRRTLERLPQDFWTPRLLARAYQVNGDEDAAREVFLRLMPGWVRPLARIQDRVLGTDRALRNLLLLDTVASGRRCRRDALGTAFMWAHLGERERMLECLEIAARDHLWYAVSEPVLRPYHGDPRFREIVAQAGFPLPDVPGS